MMYRSFLLASVFFFSVPHSEARGSSSVHVSSPSTSKLFGTTTRGSGGFSLFGRKSAPSAPVSALKAAAQRNTSGSLQSLSAHTKSLISPPAVSTTPSAVLTAPPSASLTSSPSLSQHGSGYTPSYQVPPVPSSHQTYVPYPAQVSRVPEPDTSSHFLTGMAIGSLASHHDTVIVQQPQQQVLSNSVSSQTPVPVAQSSVSVPQTHEHHSHWVLWSILGFVALVGLGGGVYALRRSSRHRGLMEHALWIVLWIKFRIRSNTVSERLHPRTPQADLSSFVNPFKVCLGLSGMEGRSSVILLDIGARAQSMVSSGHFPILTGKSFQVTGYSSMELSGELRGVTLERIYLDDTSLFLQIALVDKVVQDIMLFSTVSHEQMPESEVSLTMEGRGIFNHPTLTIPSNNGDVVCRRLWGDDNLEPMLDTDERIVEKDGDNDNRHMMMFYEADGGEQVIADIRLAVEPDGTVTDYATLLCVGYKIDATSLTVA